MKKKQLMLSTLFLASTTLLQAQTRHHSNNPFTRHQPDPITQSILQHQRPQAAQRGTAVTDRLTGWRLNYGGGDIDSTHYKYNNNSRGSNLDNNVLNTYLERGFFAAFYEQAQPYPLAVSRNAPASKYDSAYFQTKEGDTVRSMAYMGRTYAGNAVSKEYSDADNFYGGIHYHDKTRVDYTYDASGNILNVASNNDTSAGLTGSYAPQLTYSYNYNAGHVIRDSSVSYQNGTAMPSEVISYTYDASGNLIGSVRKADFGMGLEVNNRNTYTYANNKLYTSLTEYTTDGGITWENNSIDTFKYQGNNVIYTSTFDWDDNSSSWMQGYVTNSYYNAQNNLDSQLSANVIAGASTPSEKIAYSYNAYNHYQRVYVYDYDGTGYSLNADLTLDLYYETFTPTGINNVAKEKDMVSIYPVPASNLLNIRFKDAVQHNAGLRIYNAMGQLMQYTTLSKDAQVDISSLAPGTYTAEVNDGTGVQHLPFVKL